MERFLHDERFLVNPSSPSREPDIDFNDVFGGPPKRSTSHESRYSFTESTRRNSRTKEDDEDEFLQRNPWSGRKERPVFGEEMGSRRKHPSDDFYDDIFRGDEPVGSPRRASHEPFGSGPGSRVLSPARPLPPRADSFGTSLPAQVQFSLPAKLTRGIDSPSLSSGNRSQNKYKEPISNAKGFPFTPSSPLYRPSPLSHEVSLISEVPSLTIKPAELKSPEAQIKVKNNEKVNTESKSTEAENNGNQFHFSIYKWASKGVPMLVPLRGFKSSKLKEAIKTEILSSYSETDGQDSKRNVSTNNKVHHAEEMKQGKGSPSKTMNTNFGTVSINAISSDKRVEIQGVAEDAQEDQNPELKSLRSFLGTSEEEGRGKANKKAEQKDKQMKKTTVFDKNEDISKSMHKRDEKKYNSKREEVVQVKEPQLVDSKRAKDNIVKRKPKGKVDEFVNIFNKEADLKPKIDIEKQNKSSERGSASVEKADKNTSANRPQINRNQVHGLDKVQTPANTAAVLNKNVEDSKKQHSHSKTPVSKVKGNFSDRKDDQASHSESRPDNTQDLDDDINDLFNETFTVKELTNEQEKPVQGEDNYEDVQTSDATIRKWSRGKEGNIRSLLSTLQYVLWPGSGWKPVPLVDIIEGSAVKRSYQRAMLCLHPDKLQQKGAADYQKYIAEKVFDILQEAWDQFNSLGLT